MTAPKPSQGSPAPLIKLRPRASIFEISPERVQISFANHSATFQGAPVVKGMMALIPLLQAGGEKDVVTAAASKTTQLEQSFLEYLIGLLENANCLYEESEPVHLTVAQATLAEFYASAGQDPVPTLATLAAARPVIAAPESARDSLADALGIAGISADFADIPNGSSCDAAVACFEERLADSAGILVAWDFPYRSPFARRLNDLALKLSVPALFGACEGLSGRIGPYVVPRNTPCLECLNNRLLANAGAPERIAYEQYRSNHANAIPAPWPTHPLFRDAVERLFVLELVQILLNRPPRTIGGLLELSFAEASIERHPVYKVPRFEACYPKRPPRLPWQVKFAAPTVKGGGE